MNGRGGSLGSAVSSVPQVYFDLIARVIPGVVVLSQVALAVVGPDAFLRTIDATLARVAKVGAIGALFAVMVVIVFSYAYAVLLWYPGYYLASKVKRRGGRWDHDENIKLHTETIRFRLAYERLKRKDPVAGERVTKLKAQVHMSEVLFAGFLLSIPAGIVAIVQDWPRSIGKNLPVCICATVFAFLSYLSRGYFVDHMIASLETNLRLANEEQAAGGGKEGPQRKKQNTKTEAH